MKKAKCRTGYIRYICIYISLVFKKGSGAKVGRKKIKVCVCICLSIHEETLEQYRRNQGQWLPMRKWTRDKNGGGQNFTANPLILSDFLNNVNVKAIHKIKFKEK